MRFFPNIIAAAVAVSISLRALEKLGDHRQHGDLGICLEQIILAADLVVKELPQDQRRTAEQESGCHAQDRITGQAGRSLAGRQLRVVHHPDGAALHHTGNAGRQHLGNGIGDLLRLLGILTGYGDLEYLGGVHGLGLDHFLELPVRISHPGGRADLVQGGAAVENDHIGVHQTLGCGQLGVADGLAGILGVVDVQQGAGLVGRGDKKLCPGEADGACRHRCQRNDPGPAPQGTQQGNEVHLAVDFAFVHVYLPSNQSEIANKWRETTIEL